MYPFPKQIDVSWLHKGKFMDVCSGVSRYLAVVKDGSKKDKYGIQE